MSDDEGLALVRGEEELIRVAEARVDLGLCDARTFWRLPRSATVFFLVSAPIMPPRALLAWPGEVRAEREFQGWR